jgi:uncharacterized protein DUF6519
MQGEYRGDFTRDSFDRYNGFSRVLMQQGRVLLDADWNEQTSILLDYLRTLASDLIGPWAGFGDGFKIQDLPPGPPGAKNANLDFWVWPGTYYIAGLPCDNDPARLYSTLPGFPSSSPAGADDVPVLSRETGYLVYLDAWERHVTWFTDGRIREVALGGPDTATRAQVVWQVRVREWTPTATTTNANSKALRDEAESLVKDSLKPLSGVQMRCRAGHSKASTTPCVISPEARYRRGENQLYRVEIHRGGPRWDGSLDGGLPSGNANVAATLKWSRDNGSVLLPVMSLAGGRAHVGDLGPDERHTVHEGEWVELADDSLRGRPGALLQVSSINRDDSVVTLRTPDGKNPLADYKERDPRHPLLRRWNHGGGGTALSEGAILLTESDGEDETSWIPLEDGIEIQFPPGPSPETYRAGDYWLIPARTALGDVLWPAKVDADGNEIRDPDTGRPVSAAQPPHGVDHFYAPLAFIQFKKDGTVGPLIDLRRLVPPLAQ